MAFDAYRTGLVLAVLLFLVCFFAEKGLKRHLSAEQYDYLRDLGLVFVLSVASLWSGNVLVQAVALCAFLASGVGLAISLYRLPLWPCYFLVGLLLALEGPGIDFIGLPGSLHYLSPLASVVATSLWVGLFPLVLRQLDRVGGLAGHMVAVSLALMLLVTAFSGQFLPEAFFLGLCGISLLTVFWSRHGHSYRTLGESLCGFWGVFLAGLSILGVSKGITFTALMMLPLGLFALPLLEISLTVCSRFMPLAEMGEISLYHRLVGRGINHPRAVRMTAATCASVGVSVALLQMELSSPLRLAAGLFVTLLLVLVIQGAFSRNTSAPGRRSSLWGVEVDNVSLPFALGRALSWARYGERSEHIATLDALSALRTLRDGDFREWISRASLVLPDGRGLVWALRFLGCPVQQRITGIDFLEQFCRSASAEALPLYFMGGRPGVAAEAAKRLAFRYPGLDVRGTADGYGGAEDEDALVRAIVESGARILFVGLGVPRQEAWIARNRDRLAPLVLVGVGGSFDVLSGNLRRAPRIWQDLGLEWLYRTLQEPWRWSRVCHLPLFVSLVVATRLGLYGRRA
ncbi:WecB/TagA/CpsF family glycosyltransferase [Aminirod propionatiphilus]|uniref:WecB/TagA/CpsF family glycosyltransferase n=1 Tax=Aminirod propionatiphilus TaxID=3415223 RepID=A0ACD1DZD0_9BACT|nr:WecB/TagA/CpsF family glycosyltransferase [Synergistota bacterium]